MDLGVSISGLPREIQNLIVWHVGDLGIMIARNVLLGTAVERGGFELDLDVYRGGLKFFLWCRSNLSLLRIVINASRVKDSDIIRWLCEFHFKLIEPDDDRRNILMGAMRRVIMNDCGGKRFMIIQGPAYIRMSIYYLLRRLVPHVDWCDVGQVDIAAYAKKHRRPVICCRKETPEEIMELPIFSINKVQFLMESNAELDSNILDNAVMITVTTDYPFHDFDEYSMISEVLLEQYILDY